MFDFTKTELRSSVTAIIGAVAFSTVALVAAVGPALRRHAERDRLLEGRRREPHQHRLHPRHRRR